MKAKRKHTKRKDQQNTHTHIETYKTNEMWRETNTENGEHTDRKERQTQRKDDETTDPA